MPRNNIDRTNAANRVATAIDRYLEARAAWEELDPTVDGSGVVAAASERRQSARRELVETLETLVPETFAEGL